MQVNQETKSQEKKLEFTLVFDFHISIER